MTDANVLGFIGLGVGRAEVKRPEWSQTRRLTAEGRQQRG